ncbi:protein ECT2-like, partial [Centruroides sculpturatus]|uniref:protein ECT2-like n=1 Tax=Centruroides sculpturatus TaxID=218467 RepID=UPI000C6C8D28
MEEDKKIKICIVGFELKENAEVKEALQHFAFPVVFSENGTEFINDNQFKMIFVLNEFEGEVYDHLHNAGCTILGPTIIIQSAKNNLAFPRNSRPLYTNLMKDCVICFSGFRSKTVMNKMATLVHHMGGCVKKEFSSKITHVIANSTLGEKYGYAVSLGTPIMKEQWIYEMWSRRRDLSNFINDENLMKLKLQPFCGCNITFLGFKNDEKLHMEELAVQNGGKVHETIDHSCTHLVLEERTEIPESISNCLNHKTHLVTSEWFWASIQMDACADEVIYNFKQEEQAAHHMPSPAISHYPKRKKLGDATYLLSLDKENSLQPSKLQNADGNNSTINSSTFDGIYSPDVSFSIGSPLESSHLSPLKPIADYKLMTPRQQVCTELLQTETNYVGILKTIVTMFKEPLEQPDQVGGALLDGTELKIIFGNIPPLYEVHTKLREDLYILLQNWKEDKSVGNIILKYSQDFLKAYPPFVNYFEKTKEVLIHCDQTKPRFHAFLKRCQSKPECGRQSLDELMIRPVQRLPSMILLLNDILKHTQKSNPDHAALQKAILSLKEVTNHINENKRKTESQVVMFDIVNDIENCPAHLLSSHRSFIVEIEVQEMEDNFNDKGDMITMFLFTDMLEVRILFI